MKYKKQRSTDFEHQPEQQCISSLRFIVSGGHQESCSKYVLNSPKKVHQFWKKEIQPDSTLEPNKEHLIVVLLNTSNKVVGHTIIATGTVSQCLACTRDILRPVIVAGVKNFILIHNHPSGDPTPSQEDYHMTKQLYNASHLMHLNLHDHLIACSKHYHSFKEKGFLFSR